MTAFTPIKGSKGNGVTKWQLFQAMTTNGTPGITLYDYASKCEVTGIYQGQQREDGSGNSFNVELLVGDRKVTVYVRTID